MNILRTIGLVLTASLFFAFSSATESGRVTIHSNLDNDSDMAFLYAVDLSRNKTLIDSAKVQNKSFSFTLNNSDNTLKAYYVTLGKDNKGGVFFPFKKGDKLSIELNKQYKSVFSGSKYAKTMTAYFQIKQQEIDLLQSIVPIYSSKELSPKQKQDEMLKFRKKTINLKEQKIKFLEAEQLSDLKAYLVLNEILTESVVEKKVFKAYAKILDKQATHTSHGEKVNNIINHFEAYRLDKEAGFSDYITVKKQYNALSSADKASDYGKQVALSIQKLEQLGLGKTPPNIIAQTADDKPFDLSSIKSKVILIDFWASWCGPCRMKNPHYKMLYKNFKDKDLTMIGYSLDTDKSKWLKAIKQDGLEWTNISNLKPQKEDAVLNDYQVKAIPANIIIVDGKVAARNLFGEQLNQFIFHNLK